MISDLGAVATEQPGDQDERTADHGEGDKKGHGLAVGKVFEEEFETERLESSLKSTAGSTLVELTQLVFDAVQKFSNGAPQTDDITSLAIRYNG